MSALHKNGYIKIGMSFVIMGLALGMGGFWLPIIQFAAGIVYFLLGLKLVLDARERHQ